MKKNKFLHTLESIYLCLRFPFLYPRNRFTGKHKPNVLRGLIWKLKEASIQTILITAKQETENPEKYFSKYHAFFSYLSKLEKDKEKLFISSIDDNSEREIDLSKLLGSEDKFEILGSTLYFSYSGIPTIQINVKAKDSNDKTPNYGFGFENIQFIKSRWKYLLYKIVSWVDEQILDRILFIPTYTELDAMEPGWRKAFGIQMCKDLRKQLWKEGNLFKYRITQIKEKWGELCWYDEGASKEVYNIISKYEQLSWNTCLVCGEPSTKISNGWISPYCDKHFPKNSKVYQEKVNGEWHLVEENKNN